MYVVETSSDIVIGLGSVHIHGYSLQVFPMF